MSAILVPTANTPVRGELDAVYSLGSNPYMLFLECLCTGLAAGILTWLPDQQLPVPSHFEANNGDQGLGPCDVKRDGSLFKNCKTTYLCVRAHTVHDTTRQCGFPVLSP